ncbi:MAG: 7-cyano-7-deazaguanine synthase QueC [Promethearchaeota archaeon]
MRKVVLSLSGGMDSATLLGLLLSKGAEVHCVNFQYGSKHNSYESQAYSKIIHYYFGLTSNHIYSYGFDLRQVFQSFNSTLLKSGGDIPEGHYEAESMKLTVVPGRNLIFSSIMTGLAQSIGASEIALGVHAGDHHIYPDCRDTFINAMMLAVSYATEGKVGVYTPFLKMNKKDILELGYSLSPEVPYHLTRTCYKDQILACGKCGACQERLEAFKLIGKGDPIQYE